MWLDLLCLKEPVKFNQTDARTSGGSQHCVSAKEREELISGRPWMMLSLPSFCSPHYQNLGAISLLGLILHHSRINCHNFGTIQEAEVHK